MKQNPLRAPIILSLALLMLVGALLPLTAFASPQMEATDASGIQSDDFNRCTADIAPWQVVDPDSKLTLTTSGVGTNDAVMEMSIPGGETLNINSKDTNAPRVMQPAANTDFEIEVKFDSGVDLRYQIQGILIAGDSDDFMRFDFHSDGNDTELFAAAYAPTGVITETKFVKSDPIRVDETANGVSPLWMRVKRVGNTWTLTYSEDGTNFRGPTESGASFNFPFTVTHAGVFVGTTGTFPTQPAHTAKVDYFFNNADRLDPEDGDAFKATVNPSGAGTVATTPPALGDAQCNQPISIQANANPGFAFDSWSGDAIGSENPKTITFTGGQEVIANFTTVQHTLNASAASPNGSVSKNPDQTQYAFGASVDVTATPDAGWLFAGWSGDVPAGQENQNPLTITMDADKTLLAAFVEDLPDQYTLNAMVTAGNGIVSKNPDATQYDAGTSVDVTATADAGWLFAGWSGDVPAGKENDNPLTITMDGNKTINATFVEDLSDQYSIDLTKVGQGTVVADPTGPNYDSGTLVKLTAIADPGWAFAGWSGDVPASQENQISVTMDSNKSITATFTESNTIYLPMIAAP